MIRFNNQIAFGQLEAFRGAVVNALNDKDILFHNHLEGDKKFRYAYPLIQYKRINQKAAILCLDMGTESIGKFFQDSDMLLTLRGEEINFEIDNIKAYHHIIQVWDSKFHYSIRR